MLFFKYFKMFIKPQVISKMKSSITMQILIMLTKITQADKQMSKMDQWYMAFVVCVILVFEAYLI